MTDWTELRKRAESAKGFVEQRAFMMKSWEVLALLDERDRLEQALTRAREGLNNVMKYCKHGERCKIQGCDIYEHRHADRTLSDIERILGSREGSNEPK
jgi:hypothetical protein